MTHEAAQQAAVERDDDTAAEPDALEPERREWLLDASAHGQRVDKLLASLLMAFSRSHLQGVIAQGHVALDGAAVTAASRRVKAGQRLQVTLWPTAQALAFRQGSWCTPPLAIGRAPC
jgi:23S rRNA pseudouridine1911/1915/1917 synthase